MDIETTQGNYGRQLGLTSVLAVLALSSCAAWMNGSYNDTSSNWLPGWSQVKKSQNAILVKQASVPQAPAATFIVRFKNEPMIDEICKNYRRDTHAAEAKFAAWSAKYPALQGLTLSRASYSGEIILALPKNDPNSRTPSQVLKALKGLDNLAYAEIDAVAQTGQGN